MRTSNARPSRRDRRFLRWFRVVPLLVLALTLAVSAGGGAAATSYARTYFYPVEYASTIEQASERHGLDPLLVCAVIKCESSWDESAVSSAGAQGLMQVMPSTAQSLVALGRVDGSAYDAANLTDPATNIEFGCAYLEFLEDNLSSMEEIVAAYNAGIGAVQGWLADGGTIPEGIQYAETRLYLQKVQTAYAGYQEAYPNGIEG